MLNTNTNFFISNKFKINNINLEAIRIGLTEGK